ncbi:hypothetical protein [Azospirillum picis]|uniref:Uncharacterized protein n=1 Tax=Azospirillum picis TaxID=488438 RepID=A0ABU0MEA0_9PROT|nr:hypothetical protein [Azospirillum picis]MBP2297918.1 hypothetical protein [Azospirillum picis]MDQ0531756.1 hypothetical protein [Azospirillum picis]
MDRPDASDAPDAADAAADTSGAGAPRLTAEELAFLLRDPEQRAREEERAARSNRNRTERRASDPAYADRLRAGDRERQRRRRRREAIGRPEQPEEEAVPLPDLTVDQAASRLADHLRRGGTAQAAQLRSRPDRIAAYAEAFAVYRMLSAAGVRPTRGALAALLKSHFGRIATPSQVQKLRDHVESFAMPGGPWSPTAGMSGKADTDGHAPGGDRPGIPPLPRR